MKTPPCVRFVRRPTLARLIFASIIGASAHAAWKRPGPLLAAAALIWASPAWAQLQRPERAGKVVSWGGLVLPMAPPNTKYRAIAAGSHTVALTTDGAVIAWGKNYEGQATTPAGARQGVTAIAAGSSHTVALKADGSVIAWGAGVTNGEDPHYGQSLVPDAADRGVVAIAAGGYHTVALKPDGSLLAWGNNRHDQTTTPGGLGDVIAITAGLSHTAVLIATPEQPRLASQWSGGELILSWPADADSFVLQTASTLTPPATWSNYPGLPTIVSDRFVLTPALLGEARFFRLHQP